MAATDIIVIGGGIFGLTSSLELRARGYHVTLLDPGPLPHPLAASTDISKVVRMEYGTDALYMELGERSCEGWLGWNAEFGETLYHEIGILMLTRAPMQPGEYEYESYQLLRARGHTPERLDQDAVAHRFPAWNASLYRDGFFHAQGGYAESGRAITYLVEKARRAGVVIREKAVHHLIEEVGRVTGVQTDEGERLTADTVLVTAGAWTPLLVPDLSATLRTPGMPVFHLRPVDPSLFEADKFPVSIGDIANTGWYCFPLHPRDGVVKFGHHGAGQMLHPALDERVVTSEDERALREFLALAIPVLSAAEVVYTRRCLYSDTPDTNFWIDHHPHKNGLVIAAGGSGHAFKFGPVLGAIIADAVEGKPNPYLERFRWRDAAVEPIGGDASRSHVMPGEG